MSIGQTTGFFVLIFAATAAIYFLWRIWYITFPHWKWREDHFGRQIRKKLSDEEWRKVKQYRLGFFLCIILSFATFALLSYWNGGPF